MIIVNVFYYFRCIFIVMKMLGFMYYRSVRTLRTIDDFLFPTP